MVVYEVVAYGRWSLTRSGRFERVDCSSIFIAPRGWGRRGGEGWLVMLI